MSCCGGNTKFVMPNMKQAIHGAVTLPKVLFSSTELTQAAIQSRRDICRDCEFSTKNAALLSAPCKGLTAYSQCEKCACFIKLKTMVNTEACPVGKWSYI